MNFSSLTTVKTLFLIFKNIIIKIVYKGTYIQLLSFFTQVQKLSYTNL